MVCLGLLLIVGGVIVFSMAPGEEDQMRAYIVGAILAIVGALMMSSGV